MQNLTLVRLATKRPTVAVIGVGPAGLVALKDLIEEGFNATGFDKTPLVGGLRQYTEEDRTSVLRTTVVNSSKQRVSDTVDRIIAQLTFFRVALPIIRTLKVRYWSLCR